MAKCFGVLLVVALNRKMWIAKTYEVTMVMVKLLDCFVKMRKCAAVDLEGCFAFKMINIKPESIKRNVGFVELGHDLFNFGL